MATRKKQAPRNNHVVTIAPTVRHLWLASLGMLVATRREANAAAKRILARTDTAVNDARKTMTRMQSDLRGNIDGMRSEVQPSLVKFSSDVEARLAPLLDKLGLKSKTRRTVRKARKTTAKRPRGAVRKPTTRVVKQAAN